VTNLLRVWEGYHKKRKKRKEKKKKGVSEKASKKRKIKAATCEKHSRRALLSVTAKKDHQIIKGKKKIRHDIDKQ
jgi:hypothetical protein